MSERLRIDFDWLENETGSEIDRAFAASIGVAVGEDYLTRLDDLGAKTVRDHVRACAWHLATWFAANWWRLRWEPEIPNFWKDADWRLAHSMASAGGGYVWPDAIFASDGDAMEIVLSPKSKSVPFEPIRYLNHVHARISAAEFEQRVDEFMDGVLSRLDSLGVKDRSLAELWAEIRDERQDAKATERRKLEAMAGYDPDDAPDKLLEELLNDRDRFGKNALQEVAAEARHSVSLVLKSIRELATSGSEPKAGGFRVSLPHLSIPEAFANGCEHPWESATKLAKLAREQWGFGQKPIMNKALANLLSTEPTLFTDGSIAGTQIPFAVRKKTNGHADVYLQSRHPVSRRFAVSRMIGDQLGLDSQERLLPATHAKTARQKFQRAFAQEFLCPFEALMTKIQTEEPSDDDITEAAAHFHVSTQTVLSTLVNKGKLGRDSLTWSNNGPGF